MSINITIYKNKKNMYHCILLLFNNNYYYILVTYRNKLRYIVTVSLCIACITFKIGEMLFLLVYSPVTIHRNLRIIIIVDKDLSTSQHKNISTRPY